jgi:hypothetical protein
VRETRCALILGRAAGVWDELEAAKKLLDGRPRTICATKYSGRDYDGPVHEWVSYHPELFPQWVRERAKHNRPPAQRLWCATSPQVRRRRTEFGVQINWLTSAGGSSGLLAVQVGFAIGHPPYDGEPPIHKLILCGIPLENTERYDDRRPWKEALVYRDHWIKWFHEHKDYRHRVKSMSGWTRELLGGPSEEWLEERWW